MARVKPADLPSQRASHDAPVVVPLTSPRTSAAGRGKLSQSRTSISERSRTQRCATRLRRRLTPLAHSLGFRLALAGALVFALFGGSLWVVCDIPDQPGNAALDALMCIVTVLFLAEFLVNIAVDSRTYPFSFFFFADLVGTASMVFEISFLLGPAGKVQSGGSAVNTVLLRTARAAKVGARIGRLSKLAKCMNMFSLSLDRLSGQAAASEASGRNDRMFKLTKCMTVFTLDRLGQHHHANEVAEAKVLSQRLLQALSTKISLLTIMVVLVVPLFDIGQYPEEDFSMKTWVARLESEYKRARDTVSASPNSPNTTNIFRSAVEATNRFYSTVSYAPYKLEGFPETVLVSGRSVSIPGASFMDFPTPSRMQNVVRQDLQSCLASRAECNSAALFLDFTAPRRLEAGTDMAMVAFVVLVMVLVSFNLSQTLDTIVLQPLERMLGMVKTTAGDLLRQFGVDKETEEEADDDSDATPEVKEFQQETELLESIIKKLAKLADLAVQRNFATDEQLENLDAEGKGIMEMMNMQVHPMPSARGPGERRPSIATSSSHSSSLGGKVADAPTLGGAGLVPCAVSVLPVSKDIIESWDLDVLDFEQDSLRKIILYIMFDSPLCSVTSRMWTDVDRFQRFHIVVRSGYKDLPYHCYAHACDVLHTVFRLLTVTKSALWLSDIDRYALMVAALCHDIGHMGKTNPFLIETKHELALRYNDKSPLENMHCARLFEICSKEETNIFDRTDNESRKQARKVCIASILATDNAQHFDMVREISKVYEVATEVFDAQANENGELLPQYLEVLHKSPMLWLELFLHFADVSNPLKPFKICKLWAWRVLEEFFAQGDEEKRLGLPVGMLNDREKINRPGSQHGFINFLVSPLVFSAVRVFPPLHPLSTQMASNLGVWRDLWVEDAKPSPEDVAKRDAEVQKVRDTALRLSRRA